LNLRALGEIEVALVADNQQTMIGEPVYLSFNDSLRFAALDALAKFHSDDALRGIKAGLATRASDMRAHATTEHPARPAYLPRLVAKLRQH
jgi:hypothetical protein